jgi:epsilon-lactone hydrolase
MASKQSEDLKVLFRRFTAAISENPQMSLEDMRLMLEHLADVAGEPGAVDYIEVDAGGIPAMWAIPKQAAQDRVLLCLHGGGYVAGSMYSHRKMYGHFAKAIGCRALILHYRRAPESIHPGPVNDAVAAYRWLLGQGIQPNHVAVTGDSAGGGLSVATVLHARNQGLPLPAAIMPLSPWVDMEGTGKTLETNRDKDLIVSRDMLGMMAQLFLGEAGDKQDPLANLLRADLHGLPPIYIQVGEDETLLDDSRRLAEAARGAGVGVQLEIFPEMQHVFHVLAGNAPEADDAIRKLAEWVRPKLGLS